MNPPPSEEGRKGKQVFSVLSYHLPRSSTLCSPRTSRSASPSALIYSFLILFSKQTASGTERQSARLSFSHCRPASVLPFELLLEVIHLSSCFENANFDHTYPSFFCFCFYKAMLTSADISNISSNRFGVSKRFIKMLNISEQRPLRDCAGPISLGEHITWTV